MNKSIHIKQLSANAFRWAQQARSTTPNMFSQTVSMSQSPAHVTKSTEGEGSKSDSSEEELIMTLNDDDSDDDESVSS